MIIYGPDGKSASGSGFESDPATEITRSFSYKMNAELHGGAKFESRDFFASQKVHCKLSEVEDASAAAYSFCKTQVLNSVREYISEMQQRQARRIDASRERNAA